MILMFLYLIHQINVNFNAVFLKPFLVKLTVQLSHLENRK